MADKTLSRFQAAFFHLLISLAILVGLAYLVLFVWFPDFFYAIDGGWEGMRIIIAVDIIAGPLLTLIVYKSGKPGLKFDLTVVGLFQTICLIAGTLVVYAERPLFFIYYDKHFYSASADTYARYQQTVPDPLKHADQAPAMVYSTVPGDPIEEANFRRALYQSGLPVWVYDKSYEPLEAHLDQVLEESYPVDKLRSRDESGALDKWLQKHGGTAEEYAFYPVHSRYRNPFIAIRRSDQQFVDVIDISAPLSY
jgi:hypothetical protein